MRLSLGLLVLVTSFACAPATDSADPADSAAPTHAAYEGCPVDDDSVSCAAGACITTDVVDRTDGFCSQTCDVANDCPDDPDGRTKVCEQPTGASEKLCYVTCPSASSTCPDGMVCEATTTQAGTALSVCVPRD
jgi:hypothetical protein